MQKVYIKTYGCSFNQNDSQLMAGKLKQSGYTLVSSEDDADVVLINSCTVKNSAESKFFKDIKHFEEQGKKILVAGCITQAERSYLDTKLKHISVLGANDLDKVDVAVKETTQGTTVQFLKPLKARITDIEERLEKESMRLYSEKVRDNPLIEIIPINEGCLNVCTFCKTKQARGNLVSYSIESIKQSMQKALDEGAYEIWLTSQDTGCYGFDIGTNLPTLLRELLTIPGEYKIRIGMGNPNHFKKIINEVLDIMLLDDRIFKFLHIPLQSGSNRILKEMRRMYDINDYRTIVSTIRQKIPQLTLANDIIVAYPTETVEEFEMTLEEIKETNVLNFSRFWLRPNTDAEKYKKEEYVEGIESKRRVKILQDTFQEIAVKHNKTWVGWTGHVFIDEIGKEGTQSVVGRNEYYKPIIVPNKENTLKPGDTISVKINDATWYDFRAERID